MQKAASILIPSSDGTEPAGGAAPPTLSSLPGLGFGDDRFQARVRALSYARLGLLAAGLTILGIPGWIGALGLDPRVALAAYACMIGYGAANYALLPRRRVRRVFTFATLCADLCALVWIASTTGGLRSPFLAGQLLFATLFVVLFPSAYSIVPPLLALPAVAALGGGRLATSLAPIDVLVMLAYAAMDGVIVYVMVYLDGRDHLRHREVQKLSRALRELAVVDERNRLAREIHDGLGGVLSSVVIQSEYLLNLIDGSEIRARLQGTNEARAALVPSLRKEIADLHEAAADSMDELRRSLRMMKDDFELLPALAEACKVCAARHKLEVRFSCSGRERKVSPEAALALFRILQEALTNVAKHCARSCPVEVALEFRPADARLTVRDGGPGFALSAEEMRTGHYGLANMRERAHKIHGRLRVESAPGAGTTIELVVPAGEEMRR